MGSQQYGIDTSVVMQYASEIKSLSESGSFQQVWAAFGRCALKGESVPRDEVVGVSSKDESLELGHAFILRKGHEIVLSHPLVVAIEIRE